MTDIERAARALSEGLGEDLVVPYDKQARYARKITERAARAAISTALSKPSEEMVEAIIEALAPRVGITRSEMRAALVAVGKLFEGRTGDDLTKQ